MSEEQGRTLKEIMKTVGAEVNEKHGGKCYFNMHMTEQMYDSNIEALDLSVRSYNCLKRGGYDKIGILSEYISGGNELKRIRNCGAKSVREIMEHLFVYQYYSLRPERREEYLRETVELNRRKRMVRELGDA